MLRPNLFRSISFLFVIATGVTAAQGIFPQMQSAQNCQAPIVDYYQGQRGAIWDSEQPIEQFVSNVAQRSWMRFDYLHWHLEGPPNEALGAPVLNAPTPLVVFDNQTGTTAGEGVIPSFADISLHNTPGVRGTWGIDLEGSNLELEFFGTEQKSDFLQFTNIAAGRTAGAETVGTTASPNVVIPLLTNGVPADASAANYLIFDSSFQSTLRSQIWGAEATLLSEPYVDGPGIHMQWLGGFRFVQLEEQFDNVGVSNGGGLLVDTVTTWGGSTLNSMYGPEVGFRLSATHRWFTFSATPRVAFTLNDYNATNRAAPLGATQVVSTVGDVEFTPIVQVSFTGEIHLSEQFSIFGGYDFMWIYRVTHPYDNVAYDSTTGIVGGFTPNINQIVDLESFALRGLSIGCVFRY